MRRLEARLAFGGGRRPTHRIHRFVRLRLRERALPQHALEQKPADERVHHGGQLGKLRRAAAAMFADSSSEARDVLDNLTG
jgi:hypothetical protein